MIAKVIISIVDENGIRINNLNAVIFNGDFVLCERFMDELRRIAAILRDYFN